MNGISGSRLRSTGERVMVRPHRSRREREKTNDENRVGAGSCLCATVTEGEEEDVVRTNREQGASGLTNGTSFQKMKGYCDGVFTGKKAAF
jgi:hypothetical protein